MSCPACFSGHIPADKPLGKISTLHGRETYIASPPSGSAPKGIVVIISDAFGMPFVNNQILADHYASLSGYLVYLPDFMDGRSAPVWGLPIMHKLMDRNDSWLWKPWYLSQLLYQFAPFMLYNRISVAWPRVRSFLQDVRMTEGAKLPIGIAGFCWGAPFTLRLASDAADTRTKDGKTPLADAFYTAHPSNLSIPADIKAIRTNISIANGDIDVILGMPQVEEIKTTLADMPEVDSEVIVYPGAGHGFAVRADRKGNPKANQQAEEAEKQAIAWFQKQFAKTKY